MKACELGIDAIGLNFYRPSPRSIDEKTAAEIVGKVSSKSKPVGLFVNHSLEEISSIAANTGLKTLQLHGDETPEILSQIQQIDPAFELIWARRISVGDIPQLDRQFARCRELGVSLLACLLDARVEGKFGGTGITLPWQEIAETYDKQNWPPLILAGGLTPENVREAIETVRPWGVDTAGGVEREKGVKDLQAIDRFLSGIRSSTLAEPD